jgi:hypothetical protein
VRRVSHLTEAAQQRNIEIGLRVRAPEVAHALEAQVDGLVRHEFLKRLPL